MHASNVSRKTWRRCSAHYVYAIAKKEKGSEIDASPQLLISTGVQSLDRSRLPWSVPLDRSRLPRSAIMAVQVQSTDVFLCYQRLRVSCALCNNFQAARPRQTTERRLTPLYVEHMPSNIYIEIADVPSMSLASLAQLTTRSMQGMCGASAANEHCA